VLLLDDPLSNLDAKLREEMRLEIRQLQRQLRITAGKILAVGKPQEIYNRPTNRFVADFVALANFLDGRVVEPGGDVLGLVETAAPGPIRCTIPATLPAGEAVTVSVRPEHIRLFREAPPPEVKDNILVGSVKVVSFMGEFNDCQLAVGETTFRVRTDPFLRPRRGEQVYLHLDPESCVAVPREDHGGRSCRQLPVRLSVIAL
jgi:iron(III) transport system ATP-binding protein